MNLVPTSKPGVDPRELYIAAMYLMFLRAPGRKTAPGEPWTWVRSAQPERKIGND
jgi:hypothetical protein